MFNNFKNKVGLIFLLFLVIMFFSFFSVNLAKAAGGSGEIGTSCEQDSDCVDGLVCQAFPPFTTKFCQSNTSNSGVDNTSDTSNSGVDNTSDTSNSGGGSSVVSLPNPLGTTASIPGIIGKVISAALGIVGSLALIMFIYGGIIWMTAAGNEQNVTKGKNIIIWATLGLVIIFSSYAIVRFVLQAIGV
jgi:hypothetical protein